ncbi:MAG: hypothetical protein EOO82_00945 [Oxalobacteraceae bacterium]|nr:MAG: hypothetical protein EOO82_00945 [Oxalobacteraceae bacterium]
MHDFFKDIDLSHRWHLCRVWVPRVSITGKYVWGLVWRRRTGSKWIYKNWAALKLSLAALFYFDF